MTSHKSIAFIALLLVTIFLISGVATIQASFAQAQPNGSSAVPTVTYFTARWGCGRPNGTGLPGCGLGYEHRTTPSFGGSGFDQNIPGSFASSQQIEENGSVYDVLTNNNDQSGLELGFVQYNIGTISSINNITISGSGDYTVKLWFDVTGSGYGVWNSSSQRVSMGNDTYAIDQANRNHGPKFIDSSTPLLLTFVDGDRCNNMNQGYCVFTLGQLQSAWKGIGLDPEVAFLIVLDSTRTGTISFMINSVTLN